MKKLKYSPNALEKLHEIKRDITLKFGTEVASTVIKNMTNSFRDLQEFAYKGPAVESVIGIPCEYRLLYVEHNYAFYRVETDTIWITDIYNEKEDFMWKLFGIRTTTQETEDYWNE